MTQSAKSLSVLPTTGESGENPSADSQKGFFEISVLMIRDLAIWFFSKIFCWCLGKSSPGSASPPRNSPDERTARQELLGRLCSGQVRGEEIGNLFKRYLPLPEQQKAAYQEIGRTAPRSWRHLLFQPYETIGQAMVRDNPQLLLPSVIAAVANQP